MARDIALIKLSDGTYDIDFENGDFKLTSGLDTALLMSIFCEQRASADEVPIARDRRGHFSNIFNSVEGYQVGSKFWLYTKQAKNTLENLSNIDDTLANDGLQWLVDDGIVKEINVSATKSTDKVSIEINLTNNDNIQTSKYVELFQNTFG